MRLYIQSASKQQRAQVTISLYSKTPVRLCPHINSMADTPPTRFPDLVGKKFQDAVDFLKENHPDLEAIKVPEGSPTTRDYREERVRVFVNSEDVIVEVPFAG